MCDPISATIGAAVGSAIIGAGAGAVQGSANRKNAAKINDANLQASEKTAQRAEEQSNRLNQKSPAIAALASANQRAAGKGIGSTFLTGVGGVPTGSLPLGGGSLLGA